MRYWLDYWAPLIQAHGAWLTRVTRSGVTCIVPPAVVRELATDRRGADSQAHRSGVPLLTRDELAGELALYEACTGFDAGCIGVRDALPVAYDLPLFRAAPWEPTPEQLKDVGAGTKTVLGRERLEAVVQGIGHITSLEHQALGYIGKLLLAAEYEPFRTELRELQQACSVLVLELTNAPAAPSTCLPSWIEDVLRYLTGELQASDWSLREYRLRSVPWNDPPPCVERLAAFMERVSRFLTRWRLSKLVSGILPVPQGPLAYVSAGAAANVLGRDAAVSHDPSYARLPGSDVDLGADRRVTQRLAAEHDELPSEHPEAGIGAREHHPSSYENAFRCWLIERTLTHRYPGRRGLVVRLLPALAALLKVSDERIKDIRAFYLPRLREAELPEPGPCPCGSVITHAPIPPTRLPPESPRGTSR